VTATSSEVLGDLSVFLIGGRRKGGVSEALQQAEDAERLGFRRAFISERPNATKEGAVLLSGCAARTERLELGSGAFSATSRFPIILASTFATLQALYGSRFVLGLGRGHDQVYPGHGFTMPSQQTLLDHADIIRRLWRGETVNYDGPAGTYENLRFIDLPEGPPPELWYVHMGGPKASRLAANPAFDGVLLPDLLTPTATAKSAGWTKAECERLGRDPDSVRIAQCVLTAPEFGEFETVMQVHARAIGFLGFAQLGEHLAELNGWDPRLPQLVRSHPKFADLAASHTTIDQKFHLDEVVDVAKELIPDDLVRHAAAIGSLDECVRSLSAFKEAGANELFCYGSSPADNEKLVAAWRDSAALRR
jgi:probable F420-dependent oxidoreductase